MLGAIYTEYAFYFTDFCNIIYFGSIIKVWVEKSLQMKSKKVELILPKSVKMELLKNLKRRKNML